MLWYNEMNRPWILTVITLKSFTLPARQRKINLKHQKCVLDKLFMSVKFCKIYYKFNNSVMVLVVTHKIVFDLSNHLYKGVLTRKITQYH